MLRALRSQYPGAVFGQVLAAGHEPVGRSQGYDT